MKKLKILNIVAVLAMIFLGYSCSDDDDDSIKILDVKVSLSYAKGIEVKEGVTIKAKPTGAGTEFVMKTDQSGSVVFKLPVGSYQFVASESRASGGKISSYNALLSTVIDNNWNSTSTLKLEMTKSTKSQLIIKEIYFGGCPAGDGKYYKYGEYVTVYNNSTENVDLKNLCIGSMSSRSSFMKYEIKEGDTQAYWFKENWTPAGYGYFYFPNSTVLEPGKQITVAISGGIDHTKTYSQSVDLSGKDNYVCYDIDVYNHKLVYPAPSANIAPSHYLKAVKYGLGTAVVYSNSSPAVFLFYPQGQSPEKYGMDKSSNDYWRNSDKFPRKKVPADWTIDAVEGFEVGKESVNKKRLNPKIDAGYVYLVTKKGYTIYRNVDKEATEAIKENKDKLVYNYAMGTDKIESKHGTTDPSGIDAEASLAKGAVIIYKDTNNSTNDFHLRKKSSLRK